MRERLTPHFNQLICLLVGLFLAGVAVKPLLRTAHSQTEDRGSFTDGEAEAAEAEEEEENLDDEQFEDEEEEFEDEEFEDEEFEDEEEDREERAEYLQEIRELLRDRLSQLEDNVQLTKQQLKSVDEFLRESQRLPELERQIERAEAEEDSAAIRKAERAFDRVERNLMLREELLELSFELYGTREDLMRMREEDDEERLELLEHLQTGYSQVIESVEELLKLGPEDPRVGELERRKERVYEGRIEMVHRAFELMERFEEAEERDDEERIERVEREFERVMRRIRRLDDDDREDVRNEDAAVESRPNDTPVFPAVAITPETIAAHAKTQVARDVVPLLRTYCFDCHSNAESSGRLNFDKLLVEKPIVRRGEMWANVIEQTKNHVMPPEDAAQPSAEERELIVLGLHNAIANFDYSRVDDPGFEAARRMTHREFSNTLRDLFGVEIDVVDRFPDDLTGTSGFDNSANSLFIQPLLMERYISIVEHVVNTALPSEAEGTEVGKRGAAFSRIFVSRPANEKHVDEAARRVMGAFLRRAYRRPATDAEIARYSRLVEAGVADGKSFEEAVKATLQAVLISPSFLLLSEGERGQVSDSYAVNDYELASRLSYFIWASMPDERLFKLAGDGRLSSDETLIAEAQRMLADPKAETLGSIFAAQWLGSQHLGKRVRLDPIDNPWCTETLMSAMRDETARFFHHLVVNNRPVKELVSADYTFMNEELSKLYRIRGVEGEEMRLVNLDTDRRGGILAHGSLLAVTSFPGRTSPVVRGKWILDTVLGTPPPPPPPNVSELSEEIEDRERLSFREKLELHRSKPNCYACHSEMDPLGFSLENYDWFGRYRYRRGSRRIDSTGQLPDGTEFRGLPGLRKVIVTQRPDDLVRQVSKKLLSYGLSRQLEYFDEPSVRKIIDRAGGPDARMGDLVREVTLSYPFRFKRSRATEDTTARYEALDLPHDEAAVSSVAP